MTRPESFTDTLMLQALLERKSNPDLTSLLLDGDLDALGPLSALALPHWWHTFAPSASTPHANTAVLRGIRRKTIARNRLLLHSLGTVRRAWDEASLASLAFKGAGLHGCALPAGGLRASHNVDVWIAPRDARRAIDTVGARREPGGRRSYSIAVTLPDGTLLDLHTFPSAWHARMLRGNGGGNRLFDAVWERSHEGRMRRVDLLHLSFLNRFFHEPPGSPQAAFAWIELDAILRAQPLRPNEIEAWRDWLRSEGSSLVFHEHGAWLGERTSPSIATFLATVVTPSLDARQRAIFALHTRSQVNPSIEIGVRFHLRQHILLGTNPRRAHLLANFERLRGIALAAVNSPTSLLRRLGRARSWRSLGAILRSMVLGPTVRRDSHNP